MRVRVRMRKGHAFRDAYGDAHRDAHRVPIGMFIGKGRDAYRDIYGKREGMGVLIGKGEGCL